MGDGPEDAEAVLDHAEARREGGRGERKAHRALLAQGGEEALGLGVGLRAQGEREAVVALAAVGGEERRRADAQVGVRHCLAVASGTDALLMPLMALGVGPGDEVITTPFTFVATAEVIRLVGATPVYGDIDPQTYNLDPAGIEALVTKRTRAIMPVSLFGQCADFDAINAIAATLGMTTAEMDDLFRAAALIQA